MSKLIKGTHHIAFRCESIEKFEESIHFYRDLLGLEEVRRWGEGTGSGIMFSTGNSLLEIFADGKPQLAHGRVEHFALDTDDPDACVEAVRKEGYVITDEPHDIVIGSAVPFPARIAFCEGPCGEMIEFFSER